MARPSKYSEVTSKLVLDALRRGNTRRTAALAAGICEDTLGNWLRRYSDFSADVKRAEAEAEAAHVANIARWAQSGNWQASAWWLERRRHEDWGRRDRVDHHHVVEREARRIADEYGLDADELIREAERIANGSRGGRAG